MIISNRKFLRVSISNEVYGMHIWKNCCTRIMRTKLPVFVNSKRCGPTNKIEHISAMVQAVRSKFSVKLHTATYLRNSAQTKKFFPDNWSVFACTVTFSAQSMPFYRKQHSTFCQFGAPVVLANIPKFGFRSCHRSGEKVGTDTHTYTHTDRLCARQW